MIGGDLIGVHLFAPFCEPLVCLNCVHYLLLPLAPHRLNYLSTLLNLVVAKIAFRIYIVL